MATIYRGFSTFEYQSKKTFLLEDIELVKMDLLNHIFTRKGERVMMPNFGTIIPDLLFEPLTDSTITALESELYGVFNYDPRVEILDFNTQPDYTNNTISVYVKLYYVELNIEDVMDLTIDFNQDS